MPVSLDSGQGGTCATLRDDFSRRLIFVHAGFNRRRCEREFKPSMGGLPPSSNARLRRMIFLWGFRRRTAARKQRRRHFTDGLRSLQRMLEGKQVAAFDALEAKASAHC